MSKNEIYRELWAPLSPPPADVCLPMPKPLPGRDICLRLAVEVSLAEEFNGPRTREEYDLLAEKYKKGEILPVSTRSDTEKHALGVLNISQDGGITLDQDTGAYVTRTTCQVEGCTMSCVLALHSPLSEAERPNSMDDTSVLDDCIREE